MSIVTPDSVLHIIYDYSDWDMKWVYPNIHGYIPVDVNDLYAKFRKRFYLPQSVKNDVIHILKYKTDEYLTVSKILDSFMLSVSQKKATYLALQIAYDITRNSKIYRICDIVQKYYASFEVQYDAIFSTWCYENEFDDDGVEEEFASYDANNPTDWMLADFDENNTFPFKDKPINETDKCRSIYKLMKMFWDNCDNQNVSFNFAAKVPQFKAANF
eukprot:58494_1